LPLVQGSHHALIEKAARTGRNPMTKRSHSPGVISFLSTYLNQEIPQPNYFGQQPVGDLEANSLPEEVVEPKRYCEGSIQQIAVNKFERNLEARKKCIEHYGILCSICGFSFEEKYGKLGMDFIHVHHLKPLSEIRANYELDPIKDLRPVCPNCHAMIHRYAPPLSIEEMKRLIKKSSKQNQKA
jgi:predicted restriction endonuclease